MKVRDVMTSDVVTAAPDDSFKDLVERMLANGVSSLPVVTADNRVLGMVSETDLLANEAFAPRRRGALALIGAALSGHDSGMVHKASSRTARELMTSELACIGPDSTVQTAARAMLDWEVNHLPVIEDRHLVGVVSRQDVLRIFCRSDEALRKEIDAKLHDPMWAPDDVRVSVAVREGVVTATGSVRTPLDRGIVVRMLESFPGVVAVDAQIEAREHEPKLGPYLTPPLR